MTARPANPFASRNLRPGAVPYFSEDPALVDALADRFDATRGAAQIIGPHGSGKSTLLAALVAGLRQRGWRVSLCELRAGQRRLPAGTWSSLVPGNRTLLVVDGFEQLGRLTRLWVRVRCRWRGARLLVTAHSDVGMQTLFRTTPSLAAAQAVAVRLQQWAPALVTPDDVAVAYERCGGDVRETMFALYDVYESRLAEQSDRTDS